MRSGKNLREIADDRHQTLVQAQPTLSHKTHNTTTTAHGGEGRLCALSDSIGGISRLTSLRTGVASTLQSAIFITAGTKEAAG
jgi:hypothetical protein